MRATGLAALAGALVLVGCASSTPHPIVAAAAPAADAQTAPAVSGTAEAAPVAPAPAPSTDDDRASQGSPDSHHAARQTRRALGWIVLSIGAEATAAAVVTSFMMVHEAGVRSSDCPDGVCSAAGIQANDRLKMLGGWNLGAWAVGAVGLGTGIVLLLTNPSDKSLGTQVEMGATASGLLLKGSF